MNKQLDKIDLISNNIKKQQYPWKEIQELKDYFLFKSKKDYNFKTYLTATKKMDDILFNLELDSLPEEVFN